MFIQLEFNLSSGWITVVFDKISETRWALYILLIEAPRERLTFSYQIDS